MTNDKIETMYKCPPLLGTRVCVTQLDRQARNLIQDNVITGKYLLLIGCSISLILTSDWSISQILTSGWLQGEGSTVEHWTVAAMCW